MVSSETTYKCKYCDREFKRENSLAVHLCEKKKRWQSRDEKGVRIGFNAYLKFYEFTQSSHKKKSMMDFIKSPYYNAFVKFGNYCVEIKAINVPKFTEYVIQQNKKLDYWCKDSLYTEYLIWLLVTENPIDALRRGIEYSIKWAEKNKADSRDLLRHGNENVICHAIVTGHISSWLLYNSNTGKKFLENIDRTQTEMIWDYITPEIWTSKIHDDEESVSYITETLKEFGW